MVKIVYDYTQLQREHYGTILSQQTQAPIFYGFVYWKWFTVNKSSSAKPGVNHWLSLVKTPDFDPDL